MRFPTGGSVRIHSTTPGPPDAHGNPTETVTVSDPVPVIGWAPPDPDDEDLTVGERVGRRLNLYTYPDFTVSPSDSVEVEGVVWDVVGYPGDYSHGPFGARFGSVVYLALSTG